MCLKSYKSDSISRKSILLACVLMSFLGGGCNKKSPHKTNDTELPEGALGPLRVITFAIAGTPVEIEIAITRQEQAQGLMYRKSMPGDHGMLFVYTTPQYMRFWMKNTLIPLSIAYIREDGTISNIEKMEPHTGPFDPTEHYISRQKCLYALEMNRGWFERHSVEAGDVIDMPVEEIHRLSEQPSP